MFGQRLRLARKKAGFSMRRLAERLSPPITAQAISKYEAGRMMPSSAVLIGLGRTLDVSLDFLTGSQVEALTGIEFRKHSGTSAKDRARAEAIVTEQLEDYLTIEDILEIPPPADPFGDLRCDLVGSFDEVEDKAGALRRRWDLGLDPVPSVTALLEDRGIRVVAADLPARYDGLACGVARGGGRPSTEAVVISVRTNVERRRLTLAHELAHRVIRDAGRSDIRIEKAMHRFAAAFLAPAEHLRAQVGPHRRRLPYRELMRLKHFYGMSAAAILIRLRDVRILPPASVEYAFRTYARSWRKREPEPMVDNEGLATFERPRRFERLVWRALGEELISPVRAAELLKCSLQDVEWEIRGPLDR
ncbi:MAG: ImmA/IrrE family metallo-endopeptidase [Acidobacteria bacterium]|nr:ImmA/IrrE family metallo-endopeptidase [Acidobacteriota bacterium]